MPVPAPAGATPASQLVDDVLAAMRAGAKGDGDALDELRKHSSKEGKAAAEAAPPSGPPPLTIEAKTIKRPNGQEYHVRKLGVHHDVAVLRQGREDGVPMLLLGEPGTGKTALIEAAFGEHHTDAKPTLMTVQGHGDTIVDDFVGGYVQLPNGHYHWLHGPLPLAMDLGIPLFVDEAPLVDPKVMAVLYSVMDGRGVLNITANPDLPPIHAKPGFYVVAAGNPNAPGARMSEALLSRFPVQFDVMTDYALVRRLGVDARMITAAQNLQKKVEQGTLSWAPQTRELLDFKRIAARFGEDFAIRNVVTCAPEIDRSQVADVISRVFHKEYKGLRLT